MTFLKTKLFGFLALSCSLISCGQPQANAPTATSNATPIATSSAIAQTTTAPPTPIAEKTPEAAANGHSLVNSFKGKLDSLGIKIALPTYVPQGFWIAAVRTEPCRQGDTVDANGVCRFGPEYTVIYRNSQDHCFTVEATGGGLGGPSSRYTRAVRSKIFDKVDVMIGTGNDQPITDAIANTPQELRTDYAGNSPFYAVRTIKSQAASWIDAAIICSDAVHMTPNEFIKIVESLDWLPQSTSSVSSSPSQEEVEENAQRQFEKISKQSCDLQTKDEKSVRYMICSVQGINNQPRVISASSSLIEAGDGISYWFAEDGAVVAIRFFHTGEIFLFSGDRLVAELTMSSQAFQRRSAKQGFTNEQRNRLEDLAKNRGIDIISRFK
ncbi:hypothetical protein [Pseudanabaena minima]|uniref:hypothetical protein n=1 Tax=Pseudanabaena minima TaxID=890415 RepID=UPI003DAA27B8